MEQSSAWKPFGSFIPKAGQSHWLGKGYLTSKEIYPTHLLIHRQVGEDEPWCLATNLPDHKMALKYYRLRMWCEELHGDIKKHGFDLESTMLHDFLKLSRLTLAVAFRMHGQARPVLPLFMLAFVTWLIAMNVAT